MYGKNGHHNGANSRPRGSKFQTRLPLQTPDPPQAKPAPLARIEPSRSTTTLSPLTFDQPVVLRQSPLWSRAVVWTIVSVVTFGVAWAYFAKIEQVVPATGQLTPQATTKAVQAPLNGVVEEIYVEDGDRVQAGDLLLRFDSDSAEAELVAAQATVESLTEENKLYRSLIEGEAATTELRQAIVALDLPPSVALMNQNRAALVAENRFYRTQLAGGNGSELSPGERARLRTSQAELGSRTAAAQLEVRQIERQLQQNQVQMADARKSLATDQQLLGEINQRNSLAIAQAQASLGIEEAILDNMTPLVKEGALGRYQYDKQRQTVNDRLADLLDLQGNARIEGREQTQTIETRKSDIAQLVEEQQRLQYDIVQGQQELSNTTAVTSKEAREAIALNDKRIAEIDSQLTQAVLEVIVGNEKQLDELNSQIARLEQTLQYQEVRAQVSGTVFDLQAYRGFVATPSEPLLSIVPTDNLIAEVFITNKDIGFVRKGMPADVRIDSFPFSEFGDIKGEVVSIGSDALPPDEVHNYFRFPARIELDEQQLVVDDRQIDLQAGMSLSANIKVREQRRVISIFMELFTNQVESLKEVR
ncbi:MAG: HlyD family efflux transporter periplasmic adaptor subunit [Spirulinaceae cyanobacterium SM2_1_0]|nr:HlyD family efflux transporter periplasmic adaptor subunit [Spirulinaceae cyanobacterium SM2_1_0]